jgi:hypothetical protein
MALSSKVFGAFSSDLGKVVVVSSSTVIDST